MTGGSIPSQRLLLKAFALAESEALAHWRQWRESIDLDELDPALTRLLPMVVYGRAGWLEKDSARNIIKGLCRRAWAQQQMGFQSLAQIATALRRTGIPRVVLCGPGATGRLYAERGSIRPFETPELMIGRHEIDVALGALAPEDWQLLEAGCNDLDQGVCLEKTGGERVYLSWQRRWACEGLLNLQVRELPGTTLETLLPEELLAEVLLAPAEGSRVGWEWDALAITSNRQLDWSRVGTLVDKDERAVSRLRALRNEWDIRVPSDLLHSRRGGVVSQRIRRVKRAYGWVAANDGARPSVRGLAGYCLRRLWRRAVVWRVMRPAQSSGSQPTG